MIQSSLRNEILTKLHTRNKRQRDVFADIISQNNKLLETAEEAQSKSVHLSLEIEKLKQEHVELQRGGTGGKAVQLLEQKVYKQLEELTELHKKKGENAQQLIDLSKAVQERESQLQKKSARILQLTEELEEIKRQKEKLEQNVDELEATNSLLSDEHNSLNLAFVRQEENLRQLDQQYQEIVQRFMGLKSQAADQLNAQNDLEKKKKEQTVQRQLIEAITDFKTVLSEDSGASSMPMPAMCYAVTIPSRAIHTFEAHEGEVNAVQWSPSGRRFATGGADRKVKVWEIAGGRSSCVTTLLGSNAAVRSVEFDLQGLLLLAATANDFSVRLWSIQDGRLRLTLPHSGNVSSAKFLNGANKAVSGSYDKTLKVWDLKRGAAEKTIFVGSTCLDLVTSDGLATNIISGHFDRKIRFWDSRSERGADDIAVQGKVTSLDLGKDGTSLLACSRGGGGDALSVIDMRMNKIVKTLSDDHFRVGADYTRAVFSPDGEYATCGSADGHLFIWNVTSQKLEKVLKDGGHSSTILACSWDPRGSSILSCDKQRTVVYWSDF